MHKEYKDKPKAPFLSPLIFLSVSFFLLNFVFLHIRFLRVFLDVKVYDAIIYKLFQKPSPYPWEIGVFFPWETFS